MGVQYKLGLNEHKEGLYVCLLNDVPKWTNLYDDCEFVGQADLPQTAKLVVQGRKVKTDKLILSNVVPIQIFFKQWFHPYYVLHCDPFNLRFILPDEQTWYQGVMAVEKHPHAFQHLAQDHHHWMQYEPMLTKNGNCIQYLPTQPEEACMIAVKQNGLVLGMIKHKPYDLCLNAVKQNGIALQFVPEGNRTEELCLAAVTQTPWALKYIQNPSFTVQMEGWLKNKQIRPYLKKDFLDWVERHSRDLSKRLFEGCVQMA